MKLRVLWAMAIVAGGMAIASCADEKSSTDDDDDNNSTGAGGGVGGGTGGSGATSTGGSSTSTSGGGSGGDGGGGASMPECGWPSDCTDPTTEVCSLATESCESSECDPSADQPAGCTGADPICLEQHPLAAIGACYDMCDPYDAPCGGGLECMSVFPAQELGLCHNPGAGTTGAACNPPPNLDDSWGATTGCALGNSCMDDGSSNYQCYETCDFFGAAPACTGATVCFPGGYCDAETGGSYDTDAVATGCAGATGGEICGLAGGRDGYAGECQDLGDGLGMTCHAYCDGVGKFTCPAAMDSCYDVFSGSWAGSIGLCAAPPASGCFAASECTDPTSEVCDVETEACVSSECDPNATQPSLCTGTDPICMEQMPDALIGACYEQCDPYDTPCPGGGPAECRNNTFGQSWGLCLNAGNGTTGAACDPLTSTSWGTTTGCVANNICWGNVCLQVCDFFGAPTCNGASVCTLFGVCDLPGGGGYDTVPIAGACNGATGGEDCGLVGGHDGFQGACNDLGDGLGMVCRPFCSFVHNTCNQGPFDGTCYDVFADPLAGDVGTCQQ